MKCFYAPETAAHNPRFRLTHGAVAANAEQPRRAELLLAALLNAAVAYKGYGTCACMCVCMHACIDGECVYCSMYHRATLRV